MARGVPGVPGRTGVTGLTHPSANPTRPVKVYPWLSARKQGGVTGVTAGTKGATTLYRQGGNAEAVGGRAGKPRGE